MPKKRKDGRYQRQITLPDGTRKHVYGRTVSELKAKAEELKREYDIMGGTASDITVHEWTELWYNRHKQHIRLATRTSYVGTYNNHIFPYIGGLKLKDVRAADCQAIMQSVADKSESLQSKVRIVLHQLIHTAQAEGLISRDPTVGLRVVHHSKPPERKYLTPDEQHQIISSVTDPRARVFVALCMYAGLRREEALGLRWSDISNGSLTVHEALTFVNNQTAPAPRPKSDSSYRTVPVIEPLQQILDETPHLGVRVVTAADGRDMTKAAYRRMWDKVVKAVPFHVSAHMLRHTFATICHAAGIDLKTAQKWLGHASISVTADIYTHLDKDAETRESGKLNEYLSGAKV